MFEGSQLLEIDRCIGARLWHTALAILDTHCGIVGLDDGCCNAEHLGHLVDTTLQATSGSKQQWIAYKLVLRLDKQSANAAKAKEKLNAIQFRSNFKLIDTALSEEVQEELLEFFQSILRAKHQNTTCTNKISLASAQFLETSLLAEPALTCYWLVPLDLVLQDVYINVLRALTQKENVDENLSTLLCILSKFNIPESKEIEITSWLYPRIFETCNFNDVELALYCRRNLKLLKEWHLFIDSKINNIIFCNSRNNLSESQLYVKELTLRVIKQGVHWLSDILEISSVLLYNGEYDKICRILSCPLLQNLWSSLLLHFLHNLPNEQITSEAETWQKNFNVCDALKFLLNKCCYSQYEHDEPILVNLVNGHLSSHLTVAKWILEYRKKSLPKTWPALDQNLSVKRILEGLREYCTLGVINKCIDIHKCSSSAITSLIKDNEKALRVFGSYRGMQIALEAILTSGAKNELDIATLGLKFAEVESSLNAITPLSLRLEVVENVFSMLFLRHEAHFGIAEREALEEDGYGSSTTAEKPERNSSSTCEGREPNGESASHQRHGFVCGVEVVKCLLSHLSRCLVQLGSDYAKLRREKPIPPDRRADELQALQRQIFRMDGALADASWRLDLLASHEGGSEAPLASERLSFSSRLKSQAALYNEPSASSDEEAKLSEELEVSSEASSSNNNNNNNRRHLACRQRGRKRARVSTKGATSFKLVDLMLAPKESLLLQCLWRADFARAQQVVEMFNMKNTQLDGQVRFSKAMRNFRNKVMKQISSPDTTDSTAKNKEFQLLENIRRAAQGGYENSRLASQLETFLASQESSARLAGGEEMGARELLALCALDLGLTVAGQSPQSPSSSLLDVASKYVRSLRKLEASRHSRHLDDVQRLLLAAEAKPAVPSLLCDATLPLKVHERREKTDFWQSLLEKTKIFRASQQLSSSSAADAASDGEKSLADLAALCDDQHGPGRAYLHRIMAHLQILHSIVPDDERVAIWNKSVLLGNSLDSYFGRQIFDLNVEPDALEVTANKLGVNLVHNIVLNCCPKLACHDSLSTIVNSDMWGCIVLNKNENNVVIEPKTQDPNQCIADILLELIQAIERSYPNRARIFHKDLPKLSENPIFQQILNKTALLEYLDLSELSDGEQTTAFFLNLWNLLFLHAQLSVWIDKPPLNSLRHCVSLSLINYHVGDLGRISLSTLRSKLLGSMTWDPEFFSHTEDLNEVAWQDLDLVHDPRVVFAMANEFYETPMIRIYYPQTLNQDLNEGLRDYLDYYSEIIESETKNENQKVSSIATYFGKLIANSTSKKAERVIFNYEPAVRSYEILIKYEKGDATVLESSPMKRNMSSSCHDASTWSSRSMKSNVLLYLEGHCWLLSYLVKRLHNKGSEGMLESGCGNLQRTACFENISSSSRMSTLAGALFDHNPIFATISENLSLADLWIYLEKCLKEERFQDCLDVIGALPCKLLIKSREIQCLKDKLLCQLINEMIVILDTEKLLRYIQQIKDINVLAQTILSNISKWPVYLCQDALFHALHHVDKDRLPSHCRFKLNETLCRVTVFYKMLPDCKSKDLNSSWQDVLNYTDNTDPVCIVQSLVEADKFELCLEWLEYQPEVRSLVTQDLLVGLLKNDKEDFKNARKLLIALPKRQSVKLCKGVLKRLESIRAMKFVVEYILDNCEAQKAEVYYKAQVGVKILDQLEPKDRLHYVHLIKEPLLMLEQLLMNCKLKILLSIVEIIQKSDGQLRKAGILIESFDKIVRFYAGKSLDFRVSWQRDGTDSKAKDPASPWTASSEHNESRSSEFVMPVNVPTKEEWIPNDKARECNRCKAVIFSMFNRRHHCRRCGRVVCAACSQQRMQVLGYPKSVLVRVCDDCKRQTVLQMQQQAQTQGAPSTASSLVSECWRLTTDEAHNRSVREEFSFEHAPNVSMCLAIMSLHSDHKAYASFLLDHCHEMKRLLQPGPGGRVNPEIDHVLIIKMIKSLLIAVKMKCAKLGLNAGLAHCDRFLSQVDLIATLAQSDCLALIPTDDSLDEHALRKLRDLLTEKEQWQLALDVSTKAGLDTQGVWAAWGKAYLKAGHLDRARIKFSHCLEKVSYENFEDWVMLSYPDSESKSSEDSLELQNLKAATKLEEDFKSGDSPGRKRQTAKSRPAKNPPLLVEILQILENQSQLNPDSAQNAVPKANVAQEILTTLNSLKAVGQGQFSLVHEWNSRDSYYRESLHYLLTYGSLASILEFYVKYEEFKKCLDFVLENSVEPELFFNAVYVRCLNAGNVEQLLGAMRAEDPSLLTYKKYLVHICHSLDKKQYLHTLYHLQLFMRDFIRAAMTCIRFYTSDARDYVDLSARSHFLVDAQKHLETELNVDNLGKRRRKSVSSSHSGSAYAGGLTMEMEPSEIDKHINTISRQMEVAKFLSSAEKEARPVSAYLRHLLDMDTVDTGDTQLPTLFGNQHQKTRLAVLAILCGRDTEEGFGIAFRIMQDYNLRPQKVYSLAGHVLALEKKIGSIEQLIKCCRSSGAPDSTSDRVLTHCVKLLLHDPQAEVDCLIRLINDVELKISSYIESKQLKAAYLLAVKHQRAQDIRKILKEADRLGQNAIRAICTKWLNQTQKNQ